MISNGLIEHILRPFKHLENDIELEITYDTSAGYDYLV